MDAINEMQTTLSTLAATLRKALREVEAMQDKVQEMWDAADEEQDLMVAMGQFEE